MSSSRLLCFCLLFSPTLSTLRKSSECSQSLGCISNPEKTVMLSWRPASNSVQFTLRGYIGEGNLYLAVGLSSDERMGEDDVTECVHSDGSEVRVFSSYNTGRSNRRYNDGGLTNTSGMYETGVIQCSFTRPVTGSDPRHGLDQPWHVLLVWGQLVPGTDDKMKHEYVSASGGKISMQAVGSFETTKLSPTLINLHGALMMIAWVTMTSVGIIIARHYKGLVPDTEICGKRIWFQVHRVLMCLVVLLTAIGVIVIFVEVGGYVKADYSTDPIPFLHPILGLTVTALSVLNPILALFRPGPTAPRRPIFNWVHRCVGTGSHVIALVTVFLGLKLETADASFSMLIVLGVFVAWHVVIEVVLFLIVHLHKRRTDDKKKESQAYTVQDGIDNRPTRPGKVTGFQEILLMLHSAVAMATAIFLMALLIPERQQDH